MNGSEVLLGTAGDRIAELENQVARLQVDLARARGHGSPPDDAALLKEIATQLDDWARASWARMAADAHAHEAEQTRAQRELANRLWVLIGKRAGDAPVGETAGGAR